MLPGCLPHVNTTDISNIPCRNRGGGHVLPYASHVVGLYRTCSFHDLTGGASDSVVSTAGQK